MKISVIVPVYNQEKYIGRCLDSILGQSLEDIEVILVDDGSTDSTPEILHSYQQKDPRITILQQQNLYAGVARNNGLAAAQGDYAIFWDSDDYFAEDALESLYREIIETDADICVGNATKEDVQTGIVRERCYLNWNMIPEKRPFNVHDIPQYIFNFGKNCAWNKLYKKSFIQKHNLQFSSSKQANDVSFVMASLVLAEKITVTDEVTVFYQYRNEGSLSGNALHVMENILHAYLEVRHFLQESGYWENPAIQQSFLNKAFGTFSFFFTMFEDYGEYKIFYQYFQDKALPALEIKKEDSSLMFSAKSANELLDLLSCEADEFIFRRYAYYQKKNLQNMDKFLRTKGKLEKSNQRNSRLKEKVESQKLEKEQMKQKLLERRDKINLQKEKIQQQKESLQQKNEKIQQQKESLQQKNEKIQDQKALLEKKLVKAAVKIHTLIS